MDVIDPNRSSFADDETTPISIEDIDPDAEGVTAEDHGWEEPEIQHSPIPDDFKDVGHVMDDRTLYNLVHKTLPGSFVLQRKDRNDQPYNVVPRVLVRFAASQLFLDRINSEILSSRIVHDEEREFLATEGRRFMARRVMAEVRTRLTVKGKEGRTWVHEAHGYGESMTRQDKDGPDFRSRAMRMAMRAAESDAYCAALQYFGAVFIRAKDSRNIIQEAISAQRKAAEVRKEMQHREAGGEAFQGPKPRQAPTVVRRDEPAPVRRAEPAPVAVQAPAPPPTPAPAPLTRMVEEVRRATEGPIRPALNALSQPVDDEMPDLLNIPPEALEEVPPTPVAPVVQAPPPVAVAPAPVPAPTPVEPPAPVQPPSGYIAPVPVQADGLPLLTPMYDADGVMMNRREFAAAIMDALEQISGPNALEQVNALEEAYRGDIEKLNDVTQRYVRKAIKDKLKAILAATT